MSFEKKEIYKLATQHSRAVLQEYFQTDTAFGDRFFQKNPLGKKIVKVAYDNLITLLSNISDKSVIEK